MSEIWPSEDGALSRTLGADADTSASTLQARLASLFPVIMGIFNMTEDSFSGDGLIGKPRSVLENRIAAMRMAGAEIIDFGGMSTRPGSTPVSGREELRRLQAVVPLAATLPGPIMISVDTYRHPAVEFALSWNASIINSVWGVRRPTGGINVDLLRMVGSSPSSLVLMHNGHGSAVSDERLGGYFNGPARPAIVENVYSDLCRQVDVALSHGIPAERLILDPGLGFGKTPQETLLLLRGIRRLTDTGIPVLVSASRKSVVGFATSTEVSDTAGRDAGTHASTAYSVLAGVSIVRTHDVAGNYRSAQFAHALRTSQLPPGSGDGSAASISDSGID